MARAPGPARPPFDVLRDYLAARASFSDAEFDVVRATVVQRHLRAGDYLQRAGDVPQYAAFVARGCLRTYVIDAKGKEHIVSFAPETWWLADGPALMNRTPSQYFIDAIEDSDLMLLDGLSHQTLVTGIPGFAAAFRTRV